jgi:hypothetical protein
MYYRVVILYAEFRSTEINWTGALKGWRKPYHKKAWNCGPHGERNIRRPIKVWIDPRRF